MKRPCRCRFAPREQLELPFPPVVIDVYAGLRRALGLEEKTPCSS